MRKLAIYHLETLAWIARLGTFRAAAERLNTTQPAISARVREIESQLGIEIFRREGRGVVAVDGKMVDAPVVKRARHTLDLARLAEGGEAR